MARRSSASVETVVKGIEKLVGAEQRWLRRPALPRHNWANAQETLHSYELFARYVMPRFQGTATVRAARTSGRAAPQDDLQSQRGGDTAGLRQRRREAPAEYRQRTSARAPTSRGRPPRPEVRKPGGASATPGGSTPSPCRPTSVVVPADPPDDASHRDLNERRVGAASCRAGRRRVHVPRARIALTEVAHRAVIDEVERAVGAEHRRCWDG